ncbi:MAG: hypothetical protein ACD_56C00073G0006 [uncultured bacterium]|nr:MAG: hypothetical protein ACD_56C00073G0006 [uncultured bacterium]
MQKTYWWRFVGLFLGLIVLGWGYISINVYEIGICEVAGDCFFKYHKYIDYLMQASLSLIFTSAVLFFVNDFVFKKWLKFAIAWITLATIFIIFAPTSSTQIVGNPTKESVSIWMGSLFVIISIIQMIVLSKNQKKI